MTDPTTQLAAGLAALGVLDLSQMTLAIPHDDGPAAKYENGQILWRGSDWAFAYMTPWNARALLTTFQLAATAGDLGVPGWRETCAGYVADLTNAIQEQDADMLEGEHAA